MLGLCHCGCGLPTRIPKKSNTRDGDVKGQPRKFLQGHQHAVPPRFEYRDGFAVMFVKLNGAVVETKIDIDNVARLEKLGQSWQARARNGIHYYVATVIKKKTTILHRWLLDCPADKIVDHINGDTLDNRRSNIRITTTSINNLNHSVTWAKSGARGVWYREDKKRWVAHLQRDKKTALYKHFVHKHEAIAAVQNYLRENGIIQSVA